METPFISTFDYFDPSAPVGNAALQPGIPFITYFNGQMVLNIPPGSKVVTNVGGNLSSTLDDGSGNVVVGGTITAGGVATSPVVKSTSVAPSAALNTVETIIGGPLTLVAGTTLKVGSKIRLIAEGTCTASVANASTFNLRAGTLGTTADASVATWAVTSAAAGSNIPFRVTIELTVQTLGAAGTAFGSMVVLVTGLATGVSQGIAAFPVTVIASTSSTFATTTATKLSLTYLSAASTTTSTFADVSIEVLP